MGEKTRSARTRGDGVLRICVKKGGVFSVQWECKA